MTVLRLLPPSGTAPHNLIICLHGVGANAASLRSLGQKIHSANSASAVVIPDAPNQSDFGGPGRQWFSVRGITDANRADRINMALPWLNAFIRAECRQWHLTEDDVGVCGFSQGAMMALALLQTERPPGAIASIAGRIAAPIMMQSDPSTEIFLSHGDLDTVVPFACLGEAFRAFQLGGFTVTQLPIAGLGHMIETNQAKAASEFLARCLAAKKLKSEP
ncbi:alpha/beta hydrolase [Blastomonas sp.]|uniref:alpha/beta hydrolase n=1 Tax=Blastomonas sp. TaxID=1909299 RepID=UPI0035939A2D